MTAVLVFCLFAGLFARASAEEGQVGRRSKVRGEKTAAPATTTAAAAPAATPTTSIGSLHLSPSTSRAWKRTPIAVLKRGLPEGSSLYVVANPAGETGRLRGELTKLGPAARIIDESARAVVIYADREVADRLMAMQQEPWLEIVEPLTAARKLTAPLQEYLSRVKSAENPPASRGPREAESGARPRPARRDAGPDLAPPAADPAVDVTYYLFKGQGDEDVRRRLSEAGGTFVAAGEGESISVLRASVPASKVEDVAASTAVREVTLRPKYVKKNDVAQKILVRNPPVYTPPIHGAGQVVGHSDSGLDAGKDDETLHPALRGRLRRAFALGRPAPRDDWSDRGGHGTHTAGSILGVGPFPGIAPEAKLVHQSLDDDDGELSGIPTLLNTLFQQAYDEGARVHSNSWGVPAIDRFGANANGGVYLNGSEVDDWTWNEGEPRDMLVVFAAGNDGDFGVAGGRMTVTAPATAKNCLTVGASENVRADAGDAGDDVNDLAYFSSKGPTRENRTKPDVVAPGTWIASVRTHGEALPFADDLEAVAFNNGSPAAWQATAGFQPVRGPAGGALSGVGVWMLARSAAAGVGAADALTSPAVAAPRGHQLFLEFWLRGDASGLSSLRFGVDAPSLGPASLELDRRNYASWTQFRTQLPPDYQGRTIRINLSARQATPAAPVTLFFDDFKLTTFSSWGPLSSIGAAAPGSPEDRDFTFEGGTSMATPLTAGCATLVRQSLTDTGTGSPSAELVKAILINSADPHRGPRPNFQSGWGLVNLRRAIEGDYDFDHETKLEQGEEMNYTVPVPAGVKELRATLVWADAPSAILVNDLDLKLTSPSGASIQAQDPDSNKPDRTNNVEGVDVGNPEVGAWKVSVTAHKVAAGLKLPYAIVYSQIK